MSSQPRLHSVPDAPGGIPAHVKWKLAVLLSVIAGAVDVIGLLNFGLFTAHITGNLVIIAARLLPGGAGGPPRATQILAVPVFILGVAAVWCVAKALKRYGAALTRPLLIVHLLLLTSILILSALQGRDSNRRALTGDVTATLHAQHEALKTGT